MDQKKNTILIAIITALATLAVVLVVVFVLILNGTIPTAKPIIDEGQTLSEQHVPVIPPTDPQPTDEVVEPSEPEVQPTTMYVANVNNSIYLRSEPAEDENNILTTIPLGAQVVWLENTDTVFSKVSYGGATGYVKRDYLSATAPQPKSYTSTNTQISKYVYVANVENSIYLRSGASENSNNIITTIPLGTRVGYIERTDSVFSKINYNGTIGYAKTCYLVDAYDPGYTYMVVYNVKHSIYLRSTPYEKSNNIICEIPLGSVVRYLGNAGGGFYKISYNGHIGYSKSIYLR